MRDIFDQSLLKTVFTVIEDPIRSELFSRSRLEAHAESLARAQTVTSDPRKGRDLAPRVRENSSVLESAYQHLLQAVEEKRAITPAAEWLIDNFHIVRAQLKDIREHLPPAYYRELPKIEEGFLKGLPRVYGIAWAFIAHTDSRFDSDLLKIFLRAYQRIQPLTIGELWAIPTTLRLVLIENLRRLSVRMVNSQRGRLEADKIADSLLGLGESRSKSVEQVINELRGRPIGQAVAVQLLQRLRFQEARVGELFEFLNQRLSEQKLALEVLVADEHNAQAAGNVTTRNIITSMRLMQAYEWKDFFEENSLVDQVLRENSNFGSMDFTTRDRYRHALEELARNSPYSEIEIAKAVIDQTKRPDASTDPGTYLIGGQRIKFEKQIRFRRRIRLRLLRWYIRNGTALYLGSLFILTTLLSVVTFEESALSQHPFGWIVAILLAIVASEIAIALVNRLTVAFLGPKYLPRLNFERAIPEKCKSFLVVPTMLTDPKKVREQLEQIEIHYLSNQDPNIYLALLTDFKDANTETVPTDQKILEAAYRELKTLNEKYPVSAGDHPRFSIYHRRRLFNPREGVWMGWERKRGKLHEFNRLLLGETETSYADFGGIEVRVPNGIKYVITLDADTKLPRNAVAQLIGTMAHPLNEPKFDSAKQKIIAGYGILQPRVTPSLPSTRDTTLFRVLSTGRSGIDPYASAVSDVYQDLFGEGSFTGKGIYDVEAFEKALKGRFPENSVLSHDLIEGNFARCGFLSDVEFFEDFPSHIGVASMRNHRWTRGDWMLLRWIFGRRGKEISAIGRWKMVDNLRRSLVAPASLLLFLGALTLNKINQWPLLILLLVGTLAPALITLWADLWPKRRQIPILHHLSFSFEEFRNGILRAVLAIILLPHNAWMSVDAIVRALYRMFISKKKLLEWTTAAQAQAASTLQLRSFVRSMSGGILSSLVGLICILLFGTSFTLAIAAPFVIIWLASPALAQYFSKPPPAKFATPLDADQIWLLQSTARRIWRFFATFVTQEENFLPPDNFQEDPTPVVAHRSSPTNFGLYLLSVLSANDFGWIGKSESIERIEATLKSMLLLQRHQGHFFNWYETTDRRALEPRYISSVDNGNLAGHLLAVSAGIAELIDTPLQFTGFNRGILNTLALLDEELAAYKIEDDLISNVKTVFAELSARLLTPDHMIANRTKHWETLRTEANNLVKHARMFAGDPIVQGKEEILAWSRALQADIQSSARDYLSLIAWSEFSNEKFPDDAELSDRHWWEGVRLQLSHRVSIREIASHCSKIVSDILAMKSTQPPNSRAIPVLDAALEELEKAISQSQAVVQRAREVQGICRQLVKEMDFGILYEPVRKLFSIGMRVAEGELDPSYYDLLASEARLTSFVAIAKGDVPVSHWFRLGRSQVRVGDGAALVSWSGSMFEYLMPSIVMKNPAGSLLDETCKRIIGRQVEYGNENNVPWGISESAYNKRDLHLTYQYSNFGLPDLGLKRGLGADLVIAPYATLLAAMYEPTKAVVNLAKLKEQGASGAYGFYEAIDYTQSRLPEGKPSATVKAYMAHHQGMALVSLSNLFFKSSMQRRFHSDQSVQATDLLLQERTPRTVGTLPSIDETIDIEVVREPVEHIARRYHNANRPVPTTQLLSNGEYTVMLTSSGAGFSRVRDLAVTRWREDVTKDNYGTYFYLKDCETKKVWSAGYQPVCSEATRYEVSFAEDRARITREDHGIVSDLEVFVSPEDSAEVRRLSLTNRSSTAREIEITSFAEVVLNTQAADLAHPAFSNLFVETEFKPEFSAIFATRRPRSHKDTRRWMMHSLRTDRYSVGTVQFETDRSVFIGRGRSASNPIAVFESERLSGTVGAVLDPVVALRTRVRLEPGVTTHLTFTTGVSESRDAIELMAEKFSDPSVYTRVSDLAWTQAQVKLYHLGIEPDEAHLYQRLTTRLLFSDSSLRPPSELTVRNVKDVTGLWAHGISGDFPIVIVRIDDIEDRNLVRDVLKAQVYLATKRFVFDVVILNEKANSYAQELQHSLETMAGSTHSSISLAQTRGKVFVIRGPMLSEEDNILLASEARAILSTRLGSLSEQVKRNRMHILPPVKRGPVAMTTAPDSSFANPSELQFFNGRGGFSKDGSEYVIILNGVETTPAPWINVIANREFGFQVSESGSGYTWALNSRENQITPWSNDPVSDPSGEAIYISDLDSGAIWTPTALPIRLREATYVARHGQGYSHFTTSAYGITSDLTQFVSAIDPLKFSVLKLTNSTAIPRRVAVTSYNEWVLGFTRSIMAPTAVTEFDNDAQSVFAFNPRNSEHGKRIAFSTILRGEITYTCDRTEFIGRNSSLAFPAALLRTEAFSKRAGGTLDPCAALQTEIEIPAGATVEVTFVLGQAADRASARELIRKARATDPQLLLDAVRRQWSGMLEKIQVETPDPSFDIVINKWFLYQTIVCRLWARAAFYQAGGAFGFRDQLQDVMAVITISPEMAREQILRAASRQFVEGDVQHWWHPPFGRGVRTHFSDDLLWLPYVVSQYLKVTNDYSVLGERVTFLEGPELRADQEDSYYTPNVSHFNDSIYEHCARAIDRSLKVGVHGLPLMGSGDWNDGMNHVGLGGKGESVWLAWFLHNNLKNFVPIAERERDTKRANKWTKHASALVTAIEKNAWDGSWYRRAYYDDGQPLGTASDSECRIDSLAQSWAVISGAADPARAKQAMSAVSEHLVVPSEEMILLFTPPFDQTPNDPGYIKGYLPGVRENGGQYSHAASWVVIATAMLGDGNRAHKLFSYLNPIHHGKDSATVNRYKIEPYVLAGDVYSKAPHIGRGGWSWYTGSSGWMYRAGLEFILGIQIVGDELIVKPCAPDAWKSFKFKYKHGRSKYSVTVEIANTPTEAQKIKLIDDGTNYEFTLKF